MKNKLSWKEVKRIPFSRLPPAFFFRLPTQAIRYAVLLAIFLPVVVCGRGSAHAQTPIDAGQFCKRTGAVRTAILAEVNGATATCTEADPDATPSVDAVYEASLTTEQLTGVETLDIRDANLSRFADSDFDGLTGLKKLILTSNWFKSGPADAGVPLSVLDQLDALHFDNNNLSSVGILTPDFFRGLANLQVLTLTKNNLKYDSSVKHVSAGIFRNLTNLRTLRIGANRFLTLPKGMFEGLSNLEELDMYEQRYEWRNIGFGTESLGAGIFEGLSNLKKLDLGYNTIGSAFVDERIFEGLPSLELLDLRVNSLTVLPESVCDLPSTVHILTDSGVTWPSCPVKVLIAAKTGGDSVTEGVDAAFTLTRTGSTAEALTVAVNVTESGAMLVDASSSEHSVTFGANESTGTLSMETNNDIVAEAASTVTATITAGAGYQIDTSGGSASVIVEDNDAATFALSVAPGEIAEDGISTVTVTIVNGVTFMHDQAITLDLTGGTATKGTDYTISSETLTLLAKQDSVTATVTAINDTVDEGAETIIVVAAHGSRVIGNRNITIIDNDNASPPPPPPPPSTIADAPENLQAIAGSAQVTLHWDAPGYDGGAGITGYEYRQKESGGASANYTDIPESGPGGANARSYTVTGLTNGLEYVFHVRAVNEHGGGLPEEVTVTLPPITNTESEELPSEVALGGNYPNPFNPETTIRYAVPQPGKVHLAVYDLLGHEVSVLVDELKPAGHHATRFDAGDLPSGAYVYRLQAQDKIMVQIMMLVK